MKNPKLLIIGHAKHGKDTVCDILSTSHGFNFQSSSVFCLEEFIFDALKDKYNYSTYKECFIDRENHRKEWFDLIKQYNTPDKTKLGRKILDKYDIYCGLRSIDEWAALHKADIVDLVVWVDRSKILPPEPYSSMELSSKQAGYIIDNNGDFRNLDFSIKMFLNFLHTRGFYGK